REHRHSEEDQQRGHHHRRVGGPGPLERAEREHAALPEGDAADQQERQAGHPIDGHGAAGRYSTLPICFTTSASLAASLAHHALNSSASMYAIGVSSLACEAMTSGSFTACRVASRRILMTCGGVSFGATSPAHAVYSTS